MHRAYDLQRFTAREGRTQPENLLTYYR
jgi:hypothetical protein